MPGNLKSLKNRTGILLHPGINRMLKGKRLTVVDEGNAASCPFQALQGG
jgi:hypothetical protein